MVYVIFNCPKLYRIIEKYAKHPDCEKLYCFVYDPKEFINNPILNYNLLNKFFYH